MQNIEKSDLLHQAFNLMITVRTAPEYFQEKINLGRGLQCKALTFERRGGLFHELRVRMPESLEGEALVILACQVYFFLSAFATYRILRS